MSAEETRAGAFQPIEGFEILERLGSGGMGAVYRARQVSLDRIVALKILKKSALKDPLPIERLRREALVTARMDHPGIVKGIDLGETPRYFYFVMEYVEGRSVKDRLAAGAMPPAEAVRIVRELARALDHACEQGITHRDIKPGNIIVTPSGAVKLTDLGLAKGIGDLTLTKEGTTVGTPQYMSPEQARSPAAADIRSDIYSLGATLYHMVAGRMPFEGESVAQVVTNVLYGRPAPPERINPVVSPALSRCIARMMAKRPARRYQTPKALLADLDVLASAPGAAGAEAAGVGISWSESQSDAPRRRRLIAAAAVLVAVALVAAGVLFLSRNGPPKESGPAPPPWQALRSAFEAGELKPAEVLARMERDAAAHAGSSTEDPARSLTALALRQAVLNAARDIIAAIAAPDPARIGRAIAAHGASGAIEHLRKDVQQEVERALGWSRQELPAELPAALDASLQEVDSAFDRHLQHLREGAARAFDSLLRHEEAAVRAAVGNEDFSGARDRIAQLEASRGDLVRQAAREAFRAELGFDPSEAIGAAEILGEDAAVAVAGEHSSRVAELAAGLEAAVRAAVRDYEERVRRALRSAIEEAEPAALSAGLEAMAAAAAAGQADRRPRIPEGIAAAPPDLDRVVEDLRGLFAERCRETCLMEKERVLFAVEAEMGRGGAAAALALLQEEGGRGGAFPGEEFLTRWSRWIDTLSRVRPRAVEALQRHAGLDVSLARGGITYRGELLRVDPAGSTVTIAAGGRPLTISFEELGPAEVLRWSQQSFRLEPVESFLFLYFSGELDAAERTLRDLAGFEEREYFAARIAEVLRVAEDERAKADAELSGVLDRGLEALKGKDRSALEQAVAALEGRERELAGGSEWRRRRKDREKLAAGLKRLDAQEEFRRVLEKDFSVPVEVVEGDRIRVSYDFESADQLADFGVKGLGFRVEGGAIIFDSAGGELPPFDSRIGLRMAEGFSAADPLSITFTYTAPLPGGGPALFLFAFFGECIGVRSFADGSHAGQTASWSGEPAEWEDYFFYPDLGSTKPRRGHTVPYGFSRGERYRITMAWDGLELLFMVDGATIVRIRPGGLRGRDCELKTLMPAVLDDVVIEGRYRGR